MNIHATRAAAYPRRMAPSVAIHLVRWESLDPVSVLDLYVRNREHLAPWEPVPPPGFHTVEGQRARSLEAAAARSAGRSAEFGVVEDIGGALVGRIGLSGIMRGPFQSGHLGYLVDEAHCGRGYAVEAVRLTLVHAFTELRLHRIEAAVMPANHASLRVIARAGFREEGLARRYLLINGSWEDHRIFARTVEDAS
jgi:ribosomal-protein-alanine N-acetyltransferase